MHFGFSYVGLIFLTLLMVPNLIWTKNQPKDYEKYAVNENKILLAFERVGEVLVSCLVLIFSDFNVKPWSLWNWWLIAAFAMMVLYEVYCLTVSSFKIVSITPKACSIFSTLRFE